MAKGQGWHGDSKGHAAAAKGKSVKDSKSGQGWHGDPEGHARASKGMSKDMEDSGDSGGIVNKIFGKRD